MSTHALYSTTRQQIERQYLGVLEAAPDAMVIVDQEGIILLVNVQTEQLFGYPRAELLGHTIELLCQNAVEAMPNGGLLTVRAHLNSERQVQLHIRDTGTGIPTGIDILAPFVTTKAQGTGLGLAVVRQIVAAHKGMLTYHSEPGQGTTFIVELPVTRSAED